MSLIISSRRTFQFALAVAAVLLTSATAQAEGRVELEIATAPGFSPLETQRWYRVLKECDIDRLSIRSLKASDKIETVTQGQGIGKVYKVTGLLNANNELVVPGGRFSQRDATRIAAWVKKLEESGTEKPANVGGLGIDENQLKVLASALSKPVDFDTKDLQLDRAASKLAGSLDVPVRIDAAHQRTLAGESPLDVEMRGMATGTALAYTLRLAGLALEPRSTGSSPSLAVVTPTEGRGSWPIGVSADSKRRELAPNLYEFINVEIQQGSKLGTALPAVIGRIEVPYLVDHNALAKHGIELATADVFIPRRRSTLSLILGSALGQSKLKYELRTDDAGKPFLWITTFRP